MKLRVLIADDEPLCRQRIQQFLSNELDIEVVAECVNGTEAVDAIRKTSPDIVFLDVKMPEIDGLRVLREINGHFAPAVIFVTAHHRFAVEAFDFNAVDYLLKPFGLDRFRVALQRARDRLEAGNGLTLTELVAGIKSRVNPVERLTIKSDDRIRFLKVAEIEWISSADNYVELHIGKTTHLCRMTLKTLAEQLPVTQFARVSRSIIVNLSAIHEIRLKTHGDFLVTLHSGVHLQGTRNFRENLNSVLT